MPPKERVLIEIMFELEIDGPYSGKDYFNFETTSQLPRHRWYYLKEGFSSSLVDEAIQQAVRNRQKKQLCLLEPFSGTGTTALASAMMGHHCVAVEVNPFLAFTSKVKLEKGKWHINNFIDRQNLIVEKSTIGAYSPLESFSTFTEREGNKKWLFNKSVLRRFEAMDNAIREYGGRYSHVFKLAALVAAYRCCNAKRDGKALRYKKNWREEAYDGSDLVREFTQHCQLILRDNQKHPLKHEIQSQIVKGDVRQVVLDLDDKNFDLVVTSPPYLNSFDYSDVYRPELFLGGFVKDNQQLAEIRLRTIRSHLQINWSGDISFESVLLAPILEQLNRAEELWNKRIPLMVQAYFDDMYSLFCSFRQKLKTGAEVWLVVSTSAYAGVHIPVDLIIADAAACAGFELKGIHCLRNLRTAGQQWRQFEGKAPPLRESLIICSNP